MLQFSKLKCESNITTVVPSGLSVPAVPPHIPCVWIRNCSEVEANRSNEIRAPLNEKRLGTQLDTGCPYCCIFRFFHSTLQLALSQAKSDYGSEAVQGSLQKAKWKSLHQIFFSYPARATELVKVRSKERRRNWYGSRKTHWKPSETVQFAFG